MLGVAVLENREYNSHSKPSRETETGRYQLIKRVIQ